MFGVDPGLVATGWALIEPAAVGVGGPTVVDSGVVETKATLPLDERLFAIHDAVHRLLAKHAPAAVVIEDLYTEYHFPRTALLMAHARGVVCLAARQCDVPILALAPAEVKRAVSGNGQAGKDQVAACVRRLFRLAETPKPSHVADALALAYTGWSRLRGGRSAPVAGHPRPKPGSPPPVQ